MAVFGGQLRFDGGPVDHAWLESMGDLLARRGPDGHVIKGMGFIGFVSRRYAAGPADAADSALCESTDGELLALDGRLDNGSELASLLRLSGTDATTDGAIMLAGFKRFGPLFAGKAIGDYAFAYWNLASRELWLGRDSIGARTLYYHASPAAFTFASDLGALMSAALVDREPDDDYIAGYLSNGPPEHLTVYRNAKPIRPAHVLTVATTGRIVDRAAWSLSTSIPDLQYKRDDEYEEHFQQLFEEAVNARLRRAGHVVAELSGGLDSSSIVCVADNLLRHATGAAPTLSTVSYIFDRSRTTDETRYIIPVEQHCRRSAFHLVESRLPYIGPAHWPPHLHVLSPLPLTAPFETALCDHMRACGAHLLLSGHGGDEMFYSTSIPTPGLGDMWVQARFARLHRELQKWASAIKQPYSRLLWRSFAMSVLRRVLPPAATRARFSPPSWLHPSLHDRIAAARTALEQRIREHHMPSRQDHVAGYYTTVLSVANGHRQEYDARQVTYPCLHRPLVEFMLAVPFDQKLRLRESRSVQRRALRHILPPTTLGRRGKASRTEPIMRGLRDGGLAWERLMADSEAGARHYVDVAQLRAALQRARAGVNAEVLLAQAITLELWLKTHVAHGRPVAPAATSDRRQLRAAV